MLAELRFPSGGSHPSSPEASVAVSSMWATARWCATRGWPVHPLSLGRKTPAANCDARRRSSRTHRNCEYRAAGRWCHSCHAATLDRARTDQWWSHKPQPGVGVACGPAGLVAIDVLQTPCPRAQHLPGFPIADQLDLTGLSTRPGSRA
ncbi:bifunctional DNA primase/polymerase [Streptomyces sp. NPDC005500]|uniref:bifunctional DNA primase/polymerase n=1 Tax=Streptomyces sp. NPDC005500 TaxID=3155007 RepID=UPI0033BF16DE